MVEVVTRSYWSYKFLTSYQMLGSYTDVSVKFNRHCSDAREKGTVQRTACSVEHMYLELSCVLQNHYKIFHRCD